MSGERGNGASDREKLVIGIIVLAALYPTSLYSYLLFHTVAELFSIVVACGIFMLAWNAREYLEDDVFLFLGIAYLAIGGLDLVHTMAYKGMNIFTGYGSNLPTQLWIAARYLEALTLLAAPAFIGRKVDHRALFTGYMVAFGLLIIAIFGGTFPTCFADGSGLTQFKVYSEYVISAILFGAILHLKGHKDAFESRVFNLLIISLITTIVAELAFTFYVSVYGLSNLVGHYFKIISFYLIYEAVIVTGFRRPYDLLFRELKRREEALAGANEELADFAHIVSHDLKAPLRGIKSLSMWLKEDQAERLDEEGKEQLGLIMQRVTRMDALIDGVLRYSRAGRLTESRKLVDLNETVAEVVDVISPPDSVTITVEELPTVRCEPTRITQVFQNLISNAVKYMDKDEGTVRISCGDDGGTWTFSVEDNGPGIVEGDLERVFRMFQTVHVRNDVESTGVGLTVVRKSVERCGGRVWAESTVGKGSTFSFTIPKEGRGRRS